MSVAAKGAGAVVTLPDGRREHHENVANFGLRRSRSSVAVVLTLVDGTQRVIEGASEVMGVDGHYLERRALTGLLGEAGQI